jgi:exopolyphosphatase/guanosine-5'-triphosphate,3'-diphosphate pyrophosphatase
LPCFFNSAAGVRDGIIADLAARGVGRELSRLSRDQRRAVEEMARRYGVSMSHGRKVAELASALFESLQPLHRLPPGLGKLLEAAAYLHDVGHYISDTGHHKHSYYVVANSDLPGFTQRERLIIANLCRYHRKSPPKSGHESFQSLDAKEQDAVNLLVPLLRLADGLDRSHEQRVDGIETHIDNHSIRLRLVSNRGTELEQWAAEQARDLVQKVYDWELTIDPR